VLCRPTLVESGGMSPCHWFLPYKWWGQHMKDQAKPSRLVGW
jgi:hypothetical protein